MPLLRDPAPAAAPSRRATARRTPHGTVSATATLALAAEDLDGARGVRRGRDPDVDLHPDRLDLQRVVAHHAGGEPLVRDQDPLLAGAAQDRVVEADVLDDAVVVLERDPVADADRLRDRQHHAGHEVGQRLAGGEADDRGGDHAGGQDAGRDLG